MRWWWSIAAHGDYTSLSRNEIVPIDNEASYLLNKIPVVPEGFASGTPQMANKVASIMQNNKIIMLPGHGGFATGQILEGSSSFQERLARHAGSCGGIEQPSIIHQPQVLVVSTGLSRRQVRDREFIDGPIYAYEDHVTTL